MFRPFHSLNKHADTHLKIKKTYAQRFTTCESCEDKKNKQHSAHSNKLSSVLYVETGCVCRHLVWARWENAHEPDMLRTERLVGWVSHSHTHTNSTGAFFARCWASHCILMLCSNPNKTGWKFNALAVFSHWSCTGSSRYIRYLCPRSIKRFA